MSKFNMGTKLVIVDAKKATEIAAKTKASHHQAMLKELIAAEDTNGVTCTELCKWMEENKETLTEDQRKPWDKYSDACHMSYFTKRFTKLGVVAIKVDEVVAEATPAPAAVVESPVVEEAVVTE